MYKCSICLLVVERMVSIEKVCMYVWLYVCLYACVCVCVCMYVGMNAVYVYLWWKEWCQ